MNTIWNNMYYNINPKVFKNFILHLFIPQCTKYEIHSILLSLSLPLHPRSVVDMSAVEIDPSEGFVIELDFGTEEEEEDDK